MGNSTEDKRKKLIENLGKVYMPIAPTIEEVKQQIANYIELQNSKGVFKPATEIELISFIKSKIYEEGH